MKLELRNLSINYATRGGALPAVKGTSFHIAPGETFGLAGESGSGKSTIAKAIMRILPAPGYISAGEIWWNGADITSMSPQQLQSLRWSDIAMVFQSALDSLNPVIKIVDQFSDLAKAKLGRSFSMLEIDELLNLVDLDNSVLKAYPHQLSGGMRQRVGIALALALKPKLLILDEPTTALDVVVQRHILMGLKRIQATQRFSMLFITHDLPVLLAISDRIAVMKDGDICEIGTPDELRHRPEHPYTRHLLQTMGLIAEGTSQSPKRDTV